MSWTDYVRKCEREKRPQCVFQDKIEISDWLSGKRPTVQGIKEISVESAAGPTAAASDQAPLPVPRPTEAETPRKAEASMELAIAAPERQVLGEEVQFERIRPLDSVLLCPMGFSDMWALEDFIRRQDRRRPPPSGTGDPSRSGPRGVLDDSFIHPDPSAAPRRQFHNAIILVAKSAKCRINNTNIMKFLNENEWTPPSEDSEKDHFTLTHRHSISTNSMVYDVVANEKLLLPADWQHVVAVFLTGFKWQLRYYQPPDPAAFLGKFLGIYVGWAGESLPGDMKGWMFKEFRINKSSRHEDALVVRGIWQAIEDATAALKRKH
jgi:parafibromin